MTASAPPILLSFTWLTDLLTLIELVELVEILLHLCFLAIRYAREGDVQRQTGQLCEPLEVECGWVAQPEGHVLYSDSEWRGVRRACGELEKLLTSWLYSGLATGDDRKQQVESE